MVAFRLAYFNNKRLFRHKSLRITLLVLPLIIALLRAIFAGSFWVLHAVELCPLVCALLIGAALYAQWSVDCACGFVDGLRACPISRHAIVVSRVLSGLSIFAVQMAILIVILVIRF